MQNVGEEIAGEYLKWCKGCEFITYNLTTPDIQGEIDVFAMNLKKKEVYVCEVATHLETGLQYVKDNQPDNVPRFIKKFSKDIEYAKKYFPEHRLRVMLWSPIAKDRKKVAKHNQVRDIENIKQEILKLYGIEIETIINGSFLKCIHELRSIAAKTTEELKVPFMRFLQIEEKIARYLGINKK